MSTIHIPQEKDKVIIVTATNGSAKHVADSLKEQINNNQEQGYFTKNDPVIRCFHKDTYYTYCYGYLTMYLR